MIKIVSVFIGDSIGSSLRYFISLFSNNLGLSHQSTFITNIIGCLFLSFISYFALKKEDSFDPNLKLFLTTGLAGVFTIFSIFSYEVFKVIKLSALTTGLTYMFSNCFIGIIAASLGLVLEKYILSLNINTKTIQLVKEIE